MTSGHWKSAVTEKRKVLLKLKWLMPRIAVIFKRIWMLKVRESFSGGLIHHAVRDAMRKLVKVGASRKRRITRVRSVEKKSVQTQTSNKYVMSLTSGLRLQSPLWKTQKPNN